MKVNFHKYVITLNKFNKTRYIRFIIYHLFWYQIMKLDQFYSQINYMNMSFDEIKINYSIYLINCYMYKSYIRMNILWYLHVIETFVKAIYCCNKCLLTCFAPRIMFIHNLVQKLVYCTCLGQPWTIRACMPIGQIQHWIPLFLLFFWKVSMPYIASKVVFL
jgi:hypothetical protein